MKDRLAVLEEFVRAWLWQESCLLNEGTTVDPMQDYNTRVMRMREAARNLPRDLYDEVRAEDLIIYNDLLPSTDQATDGDTRGDEPVSEPTISVVMRPIGTSTGRLSTRGKQGSTLGDNGTNGDNV